MKKSKVIFLALLVSLSLMSACKTADKGGNVSSTDKILSGTNTEEKNTSEETPENTSASVSTDTSADTSNTDANDSSVESTEPVSTEPKGEPIELIGNNAGEDSWDIIDGIWSGTLLSGAGGLEAVNRFINDSGYLEITSSSTSTVNTADHGIGNYIGVSNILKPNTTYTVTATVKFFSNATHALHSAYPGVYDCVFIRVNGDVSGASPTVIYDSEDFETYTYTFKTGSSLKDIFVQVGPIGVGDNDYWGAFCPGASLIIASCVISE